MRWDPPDDSGVITLPTARLVVHVVQRHDIPALLAYVTRNRKHLERWEPDRPANFETLGYWERFIVRTEHEFESGKRVRFIATAHDRPAEIVARVTLHHVEYGAASKAVLGYSVDEEHQGGGFAYEAVDAVIAYAFGTLGLHRIEAKYQPANERSGKLLRRLGFVVEGYARDYVFLDGAWRDHILAALTRPS